MLLNDLSARIQRHRDQIDAALREVLASGWLVLGSQVKEFERSFANFLGATECIGLANGTDAIELALRAMGVGRGDKVATVANAGMYTTTALLAIEAEPFFIDVDIGTRNTTHDEVKRSIEAGVKAVVVTHLYGQATLEIDAISKSCADCGVLLLEDCAQAHGASIHGKRLGTFGDAASFSFYPTKNLGALGDGGAVVTKNPAIAERVSRLRQYGWSDKYRVELSGGRNSRLDEVQAAFLSVFLPKLDASNARRREIAKLYNAQMRNVVPPLVLGEDYVGHLYVARSSDRDSLRRHLKSRGISTDVHYPIPDYRQPILADLYPRFRLHNTEQLAQEIVTLPCFPEMTDQQINLVISAVNEWSK